MWSIAHVAVLFLTLMFFNEAILQDLFLSCKAYWADNGPSAECTSATVANKTYGFTKSNKVTITENATTESDFSATAVNSDASKVIFAIDSQGTIIKK